tara:strand:- start:128 stop:745 length:618 start_codon:yes stop_codon:yes gene_type:complete
MTIFNEIDLTLGFLFFWAMLGYGLGSVPFGLIWARTMGLGNLRNIGSGNIGATNVLRTGNKKAAALTLFFDAGKGVIAVLFAQSVSGEAAAQTAGLSALLGHCYPVWLKFKGGKGVATFLGVILALSPMVGLACCATWLATATVTRVSSLSALVAAASAIVWSPFFTQQSLTGLSVGLAILVFWRHRANIVRLFEGTEPKIGSKS